MILLDTDILTWVNHGHPQLAARVLAAEDEVAITIVSRIEVLRGRWEFLLEAADGGQLERAQQLLHEAEQALNEFATVSIDAAAAAEFDRLRQDRKLKKNGPGRSAHRRHRTGESGHAREPQSPTLPTSAWPASRELGR